MPTLLLIRHGKSDWDTGQPDHERPLNARGRRESPLLGDQLRGKGWQPDLAVVSTAVRAQQTWDLVARAFRGAVPRVDEDRIYDSSRSEVLDVITATPADVHILAVVGHEPTSSALASLLAGEGDSAARRSLAAGLKTSSAAVLSFDGPWSALEPGTARLDAVETVSVQR